MFAKVSYNSHYYMRIPAMKLNTRCGVLVIALASLGAGIAASALAAPPADSSTAPAGSPYQGRFFHRGGLGGGFMLGTMLRASRQLNLSSEQQSQIKTILLSARSQMRAQGPGAGADIAVLGNPADPNFATALQTAKMAAANRIQRESELQAQVYNVLTTEQKAQLPGVLAGMKAKMAARRAQHGGVAPN
jgi:Spy/CpxP family protein refolding chaperone